MMIITRKVNMPFRLTYVDNTHILDGMLFYTSLKYVMYLSFPGQKLFIKEQISQK